MHGDSCKSESRSPRERGSRGGLIWVHPPCSLLVTDACELRREWDLTMAASSVDVLTMAKVSSWHTRLEV